MRSYVRHFVNRLLDVEVYVLDRSVVSALLLQTEEGDAAGLQVGRELGMTVEHRVVVLLQGQGGLVLLHVLDFGVIVELEVKHERVQKLGGEGSVAVHVRHEGEETLHLREVKSELVSLLFAFKGDVTGNSFFGLGPSGHFLMVRLELGDGSYLVFNRGEVVYGHFWVLVVVSQQLRCSVFSDSFRMVEGALMRNDAACRPL